MKIATPPTLHYLSTTMTSPTVNARTETWAFGALLATMASIVFSIALGQIMAGLCALCFAAALIRRETAWKMPALAWLGLAFVAVAATGSACAGGTTGLWGRTGKLLWFLLLPVTFTLVRTPQRAMQIVWAFLGGGVILALRDLILHPLKASRHPVPDFMTALIDKGSMTDGQMLMLAVVTGTAVILVFMRNRRRVPAFLWLMLTVQMAGLLINFKRGSWFCAVLLVGVLLASHLRWRGWLVALALMIGLAALPPVQNRLGGLGRELTRADGRLAMWTAVAPTLVREHPMGIGYGRLTSDMMKKAWPRIEPNRNHLHANWAQVLVETGWAGFAVYLAWMAFGVAQAVRALRITRTNNLDPRDLLSAGAPAKEDASRVKEVEPNNAPALARVVAPVVLLMLAGLLLNGMVEYNFGDTELMFIYAIVLALATGGWQTQHGAPSQP